MRDLKLLNEWVLALESGDYAQGQQRLRSLGNKFCCLGVLCDLVPGVEWTPAHNACYVASFELSMSSTMLPESVEHYTGILPSESEALCRMNDGGESFEVIAEYIRNNILTR